MKKGIQNADVVACRLEPALTKVTNLRKKEARKKQEVVDRQKTETIVEKQWRDRGRNSVFIKDDGYYNSDMYGTDPDQKNGFNYPEKD